MGARQSKRSVDITTTPKKDGVPSDGGIVGDAAAPGDGKLERIEEADTKPTSNGVTPHTDTVVDKDKDEATEKGKQQEDTKPGEAEAPVEGGEVTTPTEDTPSSPDAATSPESKETKKKDKMKKKWSFRSISFSKKDKSKPAREDTPKNGDVTKEEPLAEGGEEVEAVSSPAEEKKSTAAAPVESSPTTETAQVATAAVATAVEAKEEEEKTASVAKAPVEEKKKEEPTVVVAPTPVVPVEEKKEEIEKVEPVVAEKVEDTLESEAPVENVTANDIGISESMDEAPTSPPPAIPFDIPVSPVHLTVLAPAITEDVASVTKAIEEIDISGKAVAAAVNEAIESANTNEIVTDSLHQNNMKE